MNYWTGEDANARNQLTQELLGNTLQPRRGYDAVTGWLSSITTGPGGGSSTQNLRYEWDVVGNLKKRKDVNQSNLTEEFFYDNVNRLDYSTLNGVTNLDMSYDLLGNITSKSDVGTYTYHATRKHQVTSTSNGWSFAYDNNGNMTSGRGRSIDWTSYNYPSCIREGSSCSGTSSQYASFSYTPDRQYWRQISNYTSGGTATTIYVGGILEKVTTSAGTDYRHMIRAGNSAIIVSRNTSGVNTVNYVTQDHLGSSSAVTNSSGAVLVNSSFDAFGKRRGSNWGGNPSSADWTAIASTTRRGFTDHSMMDNLALVHMNGRIQDPLLGRFISADPTIPSLDTQDFNRYSYVRNNPLTLPDPSGFEPGAHDHRRQYEDGASGMWGAEEVGRMVATTRFFEVYGNDPPRPGDYSGMGWFQVNYMSGFQTSSGPQRIAGFAGERLPAPQRKTGSVGLEVAPENRMGGGWEQDDSGPVCQAMGYMTCVPMSRKEADTIARQQGAMAVAAGATILGRVLPAAVPHLLRQAATRASVNDKLMRYLLNPNHPVGGSKAAWFEQALGFTRTNMSALANQIRFDPATAVQTAITQFGTKFNQVIPIAGANGRVIDVTFAWIRNNDGIMRLVTAIPGSL